MDNSLQISRTIVRLGLFRPSLVVDDLIEGKSDDEAAATVRQLRRLVALGILKRRERRYWIANRAAALNFMVGMVCK